MYLADLHCDTIERLFHQGGSLRQNDGQLDLLRLRRAGFGLQNFALFVDAAKTEDPLEEALRMCDFYERQIAENSDLIAPVKTSGDLLQNRRDGKLSALLTVEEGAVCKGQTAYLRTFFRLGVRMMTLTWNYRNELGWPAAAAPQGQDDRPGRGDQPGGQSCQSGLPGWDGQSCQSGKQGQCDQPGQGGQFGQDGKLGQDDLPRQGGQFGQDGKWGQDALPRQDDRRGLTERGIAFVEEMEAIGMIPDVSHLSDEGVWDVLRHTKKPFAASHSNARALCGARRNLPDALIRALGERGCVIGLNFYEAFLLDGEPSRHTPQQILEAAARHAAHLIRLGGRECLALGSDFDGIPENCALRDAGDLERLWDAMKKAGLSTGEIEAAAGGNVLRFYRERLP